MFPSTCLSWLLLLVSLFENTVASDVCPVAYILSSERVRPMRTPAVLTTDSYPKRGPYTIRCSFETRKDSEKNRYRALEQCTKRNAKAKHS